MTSDHEILTAMGRMCHQHGLTNIRFAFCPKSACTPVFSRVYVYRGDACGTGDTLAAALADLPPPHTLADEVAELERQLAAKRAAMTSSP